MHLYVYLLAAYVPPIVYATPRATTVLETMEKVETVMPSGERILVTVDGVKMKGRYAVANPQPSASSG